MSGATKFDPFAADSLAPPAARPSHTRLVVRRSEEPAPDSVRSILSLIEEALKASTSASEAVYVIEELDEHETDGADAFDFIEIVVTPESGAVVRGKRSILRAVLAEATFHAEPFRETA